MKLAVIHINGFDLKVLCISLFTYLHVDFKK
jgi:hypothetical protein